MSAAIMDNIFQKLRNLDAYPKINEDFSSRTFYGGVISVASFLVTLLLFFSEFRLYLHIVTETKLIVDTSRGETLHINFDITFPAIPCSLLSLDAMDISGEQHFDIRHDIVKKRINAHGDLIEQRQDGIGAPKIETPLQRHGGRLEHGETYCGSCYGAEESDDHCCNSCEEVREAYRKKGWAVTYADLIDQVLRHKKGTYGPLDVWLRLLNLSSCCLVKALLFFWSKIAELRAAVPQDYSTITLYQCKREGFIQKVKDEEGEGCNIVGSLGVNKVAGNFHFAPGKSFQHAPVHVFDLLALPEAKYNISHTINKLAFGAYFSGVVNPLDGVRWVHETPNGIHQYFVKVVPTIYTNIRGRTVNSNQYSVTEHFTSAEFLRRDTHPGVFFSYDLSPIKVTLKEEHTSFFHFLTHICAIIGGVFTVAGIIDSFVYHGQRAMRRKIERGKFR